MKAIRIACLVVLALASSLVAAEAQTYDNLMFTIEAGTTRANGGERWTTGAQAHPVVLGRVTSAVFIRYGGYCELTVLPAMPYEVKIGTPIWRVDVTPVANVTTAPDQEPALTLRVRWTRSVATLRQGPDASGEAVYTLRPGQTLPLDLVAVPAAGEIPPGCDLKSVALRIKLDYGPPPDLDTHLVGVDLWLVERMPDGTERSQPLSLRGLYNRPMDFYFDSIVEGAVRLDIFGEVTALRQGEALELLVRTKRRFTGEQGIEVKVGAFETKVGAPPGQLISRTTVATGEVISLELPKPAQADGAAFAGRRYSIRARARQIR